MGDKDYSILRALAFFSQLGFVLAVPIVGGAWAGSLLDKKFGTGNRFLLILMLVGTVLGIAAVFAELFAMTGKKRK